MLVFCRLGSHSIVKEIDTNSCVKDLVKIFEINHESFYVLHNGCKVEENCPLEDGSSYHFVPRILGGKGGFGSMLRAIGAQIEKTTSREACRDLSGRRMRDVNNEKKLKDWIAKEADREREQEERRQERLARRMAGPKHNFDDPEYHKQRSKVQEDLDDALQKGLKRANNKNGDTASSQPGPSKRVKSSNKEWLGIDIDSDDLDSGSDNEANPGSPNMREDGGEIAKAGSSRESNTAGSTDETSENENHPAYITSVDGQHIEDELPSMVQETKSSSNCHVDVVVEGKVETSVNDDEPVDLNSVESVSELVAMSLGRLKNALMSRGLKCGGTLEERAERLFSVKGLTPDEIPPSLIAKSKGGGKKSK